MTFPAPFQNYWLGDAYDEMFSRAGEPRPHFQALFDRLRELPLSELRRRKHTAGQTFLNQGITFTLSGRDDGMERIIPHDLLPRIITGDEWALIETGLTQRIQALNEFLRDIHTDGHILNDKIVPRDIIFSCRPFRREMRGV
jgi:uncharacterized circularly permuted ATP-grasp superfamily protein